LGTEDFRAPEYKATEEADKPIEICTTMYPGKCWGYAAQLAGQHKTADEVWEILRSAASAAATCSSTPARVGMGALIRRTRRS